MSTTLPIANAASFAFPPYRSLDNETLQQRINAVRAEMGPRLLILGHHYQQDEVIALSDLRGDSYQLSKMAAESRDCRAIAFCGVHFMGRDGRHPVNRPERLVERNGLRVPVVLPDMAAGCSMADMAAIQQVENAWKNLARSSTRPTSRQSRTSTRPPVLRPSAAATVVSYARRATQPPC